MPEGCRTRMSIFAHCKHHRIDQGRTVRTPGKKVSRNPEPPG